MESSSKIYELELSANTSKERPKIGRDSKGIGTHDIISSTSRTGIRTEKDCINGYRGENIYGSNKEQDCREIKKESVSLDIPVALLLALHGTDSGS